MNGIIDTALISRIGKCVETDRREHGPLPAPVMVAALRTRSVGILTCYG